MANFPQPPLSVGDIFSTSKVNYRWTGSAWEALGVAGDLNDLGDVSSSGATSNQGLEWNGSAWVPTDLVATLGSLSNVDVSTATNGQALVYDLSATTWEPASISGSGNWVTTPEDGTLDGVVALKEQSASPIDHSTYAKLFAKETINNFGQMIISFDNNLTENSGSATSTLATNDHGDTPTFSDVTKKFGALGDGSYSRQFVVGGPVGGDFFTVDDNTSNDLIWDGKFTLDMWIRLDTAVVVASDDTAIFSFNQFVGGSNAYVGSYNEGLSLWYRPVGHASSTGAASGDFYLEVPNSGNSASLTARYAINAGKYVPADLTSGFFHIAIIRDHNSSLGLRLLMDGVQVHKDITFGTLLSAGTGTINPNSRSFAVGRDMGTTTGAAIPTASHAADFEGFIDEIRLWKDENVFTGDFTPNVTAYNPNATTRLFARDSSGEEVDLTAHANQGSFWKNAPVEASLDGTLGLKPQLYGVGSVPDHAIMYSKDTAGSVTDVSTKVALPFSNADDMGFNATASGVESVFSTYMARGTIAGPPAAGKENNTNHALWTYTTSNSYEKVIQINDHADIRLDGPFCIDFWVNWYNHTNPAGYNYTTNYFLTAQGNELACSGGAGWGTYNGGNWYLKMLNTYLQLVFNSTGGSYTTYTKYPWYYDNDWGTSSTDIVPCANKWKHLAITRDSAGRVLVWWNGYAMAAATDAPVINTATWNDNGTGMKFGRSHSYSGTSQSQTRYYNHQGSMANIRVIKGHDNSWNDQLGTAVPPGTQTATTYQFTTPSVPFSETRAHLYARSEHDIETVLTNPSLRRSGSHDGSPGLVSLHNGVDTFELGQQIDAGNLPTSAPSTAGRVWNDGGTLKVS